MQVIKSLLSKQELLDRLALYARLAHWHRPGDLSLLLWPVLWASWTATAGKASAAALVSVVLSVLLLRSAGWVWFHRQDYELQFRPELDRVAGALGIIGLCFAIPLGWPLLSLGLAIGSALLGLWLQQRSYVAHTAFALTAAWLVPTAYVAQDKMPTQIAWLLFVAALLWATGWMILAFLPRQAADAQSGLLSLPMLLGRFSRQAVGGFQFGALVALWLIGRKLEWGIFFSLGLLAAFSLTAYQQFLLFRRPNREGWLATMMANTWWGAAVFCGIAFQYLCTCQQS